MIEFPGLEAIQTPETREMFLANLLGKGADSFDTVVQYHEALASAMVEATQMEAMVAGFEAANAVFSGMARVIKSRLESRYVDTLDIWNRQLRARYGIRAVDFPRDHEVPLVAAFFTQLEAHLLKAMPGDRADTWLPPDVTSAQEDHFDLESDWDSDEKWWE